MGHPTPVLTIIYSATSKRELDGIWDCNADFYNSAQHANENVDFLKSEIHALAADPEKGKGIENNPKFRYQLMKWSTDGYGLIAVYRVTKTAIRVSRIFHAVQDWQKR
jgi:plasmid stabilization system protein ParE